MYFNRDSLFIKGKKEAKMIYIKLFLSFLQVGILSFGGGYASMPIIQVQVVDYHKWLSLSEFTDLISISQMTPGPIAVNSATFVGIKVAGIPGALVATLGCILPSIIIVSIISCLYLKYRKMELLQSVLKMLRPAVVALISTAGVSILITAFFGEAGIVLLSNLKIQMVVIFSICVFLLLKMKIDPILIMILAGLMNVIQHYLISYLS